MIGRLRQLSQPRLRQQAGIEKSQTPVERDMLVQWVRNFLYHTITWKQLPVRDCREWKLSAIDPHDRDTWRSGVRSAMRAASQLPGRGPTVVDIAPVPAC